MDLVVGCQGVEGQCFDDVLELPQVPTNFPMASEKVLNWLYSVLVNASRPQRVAYVSANAHTQEYSDVNRTYHDAAETLSNYTSLSVRTEPYSPSTSSHELRKDLR